MPSVVVNALFFFSLLSFSVSMVSSQLNISLKNDFSFINNTPLMMNSSRRSLIKSDILTAAYLGRQSGKIKNIDGDRMFYYFFRERSLANNPVALWLIGRPGYSTNVDVFCQNGPFRLSESTLVWNNQGWDENANFIFVDEPFGVGYSHTPDYLYRRTQKKIVDDLYFFLQEFFKIYPKYRENDFYIFGQSYAGLYGSALASHIYKANVGAESTSIINLKGLAIGNGLINPEKQFESIPLFLVKNDLLLEHQGKIKELSDTCQISIKSYVESGEDSNCWQEAHEHCEELLNYISERKILYDFSATSPYNFSDIETFMNSRTVKSAIVMQRKFKILNTGVFEAIKGELMKNAEEYVIYLLNNGIDVLIYAGARDIKFNWIGQLKWMDELRWNGDPNFEFAKVKPIQFIVNGEESGLTKRYGPVSFFRIDNAGHMVARDQPAAALSMLQTWMNGPSSQTNTLP